MDIYDLVRLRYELQKLLVKDAEYSGYQKAINRLPENFIPQELLASLKQKSSEITSIHQNVKKFIEEEISKLDKKIIEELPEGWDKNEYHYNKKEFPNNVFHMVNLPEYERDRLLEVDEDVMEIISTIIGTYSDWKFPSLEIGCGQGNATVFMKAADPLYVTDCHEESLISTKNQFNEIYKKRLRCYLNRNEDYTQLNFLPKNQFKFILAWNVFNYYPKTELTEILKSCWDLLRPGGDLMFSYNDCDFLECINKFKHGRATWLTERIVRDILEDLGYEIHSFTHADDQVHWVECCKPGELTSVKMHPAIGKINLLG